VERNSSNQLKVEGGGGGGSGEKVTELNK